MIIEIASPNQVFFSPGLSDAYNFEPCMGVRGWPYSENNGMGNSATLNMTQRRQKQKHRRHTLIAYTRYLGQQDWRQK